MADGDISKCGRRAALSTFFVVTFAAFTLSVISVISPSWQYVYLENGRTEHHHGLWLDCKRDYSFDYGRTKEYYETLYRRDLQGSPFDIFFLPPLQCVYKFDYYIDPEDLYDHNHDENRIQNDAYQHLFLGWKIAALSGCGSALLFSASALLFAVCAFCHRTFVCASTVLVTVAAILSTIGVTVFYAWANYQDNKVIKEEEHITYEQILGWAFYCHVITTIMHWLASMLGCCVTSVSFSKSRAKLVKIEVVAGGDESQLLSGRNSSQPFKRSFSAIYRVDSQSLRQWERDCMRNTQEQQQRQEDEQTFKRTTSMPFYSKKQRAQKRSVGRSAHDLFSSISNITETTHTGSRSTLEQNQSQGSAKLANTSSFHTSAKLKSALKTTPQQSRKSVNIDDSDITYEYLPCDTASMGVSSFSGVRHPSSQQMYDPVYEQIGQEAYLEPDSVRQQSNLTLNISRALHATSPAPTYGSSQSVPITQPKSTVIDDVAKPPSSSLDALVSARLLPTTSNRSTGGTNKPKGYQQTQNVAESTRISPTSLPIPPRPFSIREFGIELAPKPGYCDVRTSFKEKKISDDLTNQGKQVELQRGGIGSTPSASFPLKYISVEKASKNRFQDVAISSSSCREDGSIFSRSRELRSEIPRNNDSFDSIPLAKNGIAINKFGDNEKERSITNFTFCPRSTTGASEVFERSDSLSLETSSTPLPLSLKPLSLHRLVYKNLTTLPEEVDRSVGSSTLLENETMRDSADSYVRDAEIRLNLFMNDNNTKDETTV